MRAVVLFPGQGSQAGDMRATVERWCPDLGEAALRALGEDPFARAGQSTAFAQPAIFCANLAGWRAISEAVEPVAVAGHSLGEFAALVAAGALDPLDALRLVVERGRLMAEAEREQSGSMIAVAAPSLESAAAIAEHCGVVIANDNSPTQVVLSGTREAIERALGEVEAAGLRAVRLPVGGAFHSPLMADVASAFGELVAETRVDKPELPIICTTTCAPFEDVRRELTLGIVRPVRWRESVEHLLRAGCSRLVETGPGRVLSKLAKRTYGDSVEVLAWGDVA
ncbi:MAG TPA: ACP S-malonyltransferase [Solirubrobacterales bacterium]